MKRTLIIILSGLVFCGCSRSSSGPGIKPSAQRTTPATAGVKGQAFGPGQLVDAGNTTPEAAWESRFWARANGDYDAVIAATDPNSVNAAKAWMGDRATFRAGSKEEFAEFKGLQILARKDLAENRVELVYQLEFSQRQAAKIVQMVKADNGAWLSGPTRAYEKSWEVGGGQPEPRP
jgi:hypothetical protein